MLACINYMNLATAKAANRATEIGMRKIAGSGKRMLMYCILGESILLSLVSLLIASILVALMVRSPEFSQLIGRNLTVNLYDNPVLLSGALGITLLIGFISGLYPAIHLTGIPPVAALKGKFRNPGSAIAFRRVSTTVQFVIAIFVVCCTLLMREQMDYIQTKNLGFNKDNLLVLPVHDSITFNYLPAAKAELLRNPNIEAITSAENVTGAGMGEVMHCESETGMKEEGGVLVLVVGDDYLQTMGLQLIAGRDFQRGADVDMEGVYIANQSAVKLMGWGDQALGKRVSFWHGENAGKVIGVVKDFNINSLYQGVDPMFIIKGKWSKGYFQIRLSGRKIPETIEYIKDKWAAIDPNHPFEYFFLDQRFNQEYKDDVVRNKLLSALSGICIFISLLGLVGSSAFAATQRTKEMGVRKALGAAIPDIMYLLSREALMLVVFAAVLSAPFSWWAIHRWMENFAYKTDLNYLTYCIVTFVALASVLLTIIFQSLKTARANPVESLKHE
jgi:putative ABC transport system permease protein